MPATTASEMSAVAQLRHSAKLIHDDMMDAVYQNRIWREITRSDMFSNRMKFSYTEFTMKRLGTKDYGFFYMSESYCAKRYKCSHLEAQRRFKIFLTTRRLLS